MCASCTQRGPHDEIGAINYLSSTGANGFYFLPMNVGGDAKDTFPTIAPQDKTHYDTSKRRQWDIVFAHAQSKGVYMHFQLAETEAANENYHDGGQLGFERKLYYRELVARFGHHLGLEWDLGEENDYGSARRKAFAAHLKAIDAYDHPVTTHTHTNQMEVFYRPLLGNGDFDKTTFQITESGFADGDAVMSWRQRSIDAGVPWMISVDEPQKIENDPIDEVSGYPRGRTAFLWPTYLSGGGGFEWYVQSDGDVYALYHATGGRLELDLRGEPGLYSVRWYDPRSGAWWSGANFAGGDWAVLGDPPFGGDVAAVVRRSGEGGVPPTASFVATPSEGEAPVMVALDATGSSDDGAIVSYAWSMGDGAEGAGSTTSHLYAEPGVYVVKLTVTDDSGLEAIETGEIVVLEPAPEPEPDQPKIWLGDCPDRGNPVLLDGQTLSGDACVFVHHTENMFVARFYLDDPERMGLPRRNVRSAPMDLVGSTSGGAAIPFDTTRLANGAHRIDVQFAYYAGRAPEVVSAAFNVDNDPSGGAPPPAETGGDRLPERLVMLVSDSPDRARPQSLSRRLVSGDIHAWLDYEGHVDQVRFWLDDPARSGPPRQIELSPHHDFAGGAALASAFDTTTLENGRHRMDLEIDHAGGTRVMTVSFRVGNPVDWPFDFNGGTVDESQGLDTTPMAEGLHRIDAEVDRADGSSVHTWAVFEIDR